MVRKICGLLIMAQLCFFPVQARDYNSLNKLSRGLVNASLCWVEIPRQMIQVRQAREPGISGEIDGIFWGPLKGLSYCLGRAVVGSYELVTFLIPTYKPLVKPEYIFNDEQEE